MSTFLTYFNIGLVINIAVFVATLVFAQRIKDWFFGIPPHLRKGLKSLEVGVLDQVKAFQADLISKMLPAPVKEPEAVPVAAGPVGAVIPETNGPTGGATGGVLPEVRPLSPVV